jgi:tyrosine-protein kinase Etk/Wzc
MKTWEHRTFWSFEPLTREVARLGRVFGRRRWPFAVAAVVPIVASALYVVRAPDRYAATARVIVSEEEAALPFGGAYKPRSSELENQLQMIQSHEVIGSAAAAGRRLYPDDPPSEEEIAKVLHAEALSDSDIIEIKTEGYSAERAAALANLVADAYIEAHLRDRRKSASQEKEFVEKQLTLYERRLRASEEALEAYKRAAGVVSLPTETTELVRAAAAFAGEFERAGVELAVARAAETYYEEELREAEHRLRADAAAVSSPVARQLQEKLIKLEYRYANLVLKGYGADHPELQALAEEIEVAKRKLADAAAGAAGEDANVNLFARVEDLSSRLDEARASVAALETREREMAGAVAASEYRLTALPEAEFTLGRLTREKEANENIYMLLLEKREEARITEASEVGRARVFSRAVPPERSFAPRRKQSLFLGVLTGLLLGTAAVALVEYFDRAVKSPAAAQQAAGAVVLAVIPRIGRHSRARRFRRGEAGNGVHPARIVAAAPKSPAAEAFRQLYAQLSHTFANNGSEPVVFGVTSSRAREGKSTIASNVAINFAQLGTPTVLIDADLERLTMGRVAGISERPGLADFLRDEVTWEEIINRSEFDRLALISAGTDTSTTPALLASPRFPRLIARAREEFGVTVVDVPPVFPVADVALVARVIRKFLFLIRAGVVGHQELERAVRTLKQVGGDVIGLVLNCAEYAETYGYGYYRYYRYGYGSSEAEGAVGKAAK